ncbi:MAG: CBS domain-containing protein, partial [Thaumarchaeota archaeon]|nr:CBS domain-containing protein [Nitrososphaerota archaeon]
LENNLPIVADIMSRNPVTLSSDATVEKAIELMVEKGIGSVYIVDSSNTPLGVVTERDLVQDLIMSKGLRKDIELSEIMSQKFTPVSSETSIQEAAKIMIASKGRLVVTKDNNIIGVVTASDLVRAFSTGPENRSLSGAVTQKVKTLDAKNTVFDAVQLMYERRIGSVAVVKDGRPYGIFTERDLLRILFRDMKKRIIDITLDEVASKPLITASVGITAREAASIMKSNKIKRLPLVKGENLVAIITARDLVETYATTGLPAVTTTASD